MLQYYRLVLPHPGYHDCESVDWSTNPPLVSKPAFVVNDYCDDDLLAFYPILVATPAMRDILEEGNITGCKFTKISYSLDPDFRKAASMYKEREYLQMIVSGVPKVDDITFINGLNFIVNEKALHVIMKGNMHGVIVDKTESLDYL